MKNSIGLIAIALAILATPADAAPNDNPLVPGPTPQPRSFTVFDNIGYVGKPDTKAAGLAPCLIVYVDEGGKRHTPPEEAKYKQLIHDFSGSNYAIWMSKRENGNLPPPAAQGSGPIILDFEGRRLSGPREEAEKNFGMFLDLVKWTHEAAPRRAVGYYGQGLFPAAVGKKYKAEAKELAGAVDAFFPSMYVSNEDRGGWKRRLEELIRKAHRIAPGKPVYPYLWPHYERKNGDRFSAGYMKFQLQAAQAVGADGVVLWSGRAQWKDETKWWEEVVSFVSKQFPPKPVLTPPASIEPTPGSQQN